MFAIDADSHFVEPLDLFARRIEPRFRDRAYKVEQDPATGKRRLLVDNKPLRLLDAEELLSAVSGYGQKGTRSCSMVRTTPTKVNNVGAATASRAVRFARNCATVGRPISEKDMAARIAISGVAKAMARHAAALSRDKVEAADAAMCVTLVWKPSRENG